MEVNNKNLTIDIPNNIHISSNKNNNKNISNKKIGDLFIRNITTIQQKLFTSQSIISEHQVIKELITYVKSLLENELNTYKGEGSSKTLEQLVYSHDPKNVEVLNTTLLSSFKTFLLNQKNIQLISDVIEKEVTKIDEIIKTEKLNITKLQIASENISASNIASEKKIKKVFKELSKIPVLNNNIYSSVDLAKLNELFNK